MDSLVVARFGTSRSEMAHVLVLLCWFLKNQEWSITLGHRFDLWLTLQIFVSNIFRVVEICMSQDLRFVSSTIVICIRIMIDFELIGSKESDMGLLPFDPGVDGTWMFM
jgi:hypothetical protein